MKDYDFYYIKWGQSLAEYLNRYTWITANRITYFRLIMLLPMFWCFYHGEYWYIIGAVLNEFIYLLDRTDGALCRLRNDCSEYGVWLEEAGDRLIGLYGVFFFITFGLWNQTGLVIVWILLFFHIYARYADRILFALKPKRNINEIQNILEDNRQEARAQPVIRFIDTCSYQIVIFTALLYYPLGFVLPVNPMLAAIFLSTGIVQISWIGRFYFAIKYFKLQR
ncbi:MAG TPA: hypothetical protein ENH82_06990 [bacterium]|nr:hypothetical protein [bacterium]